MNIRNPTESYNRLPPIDMGSPISGFDPTRFRIHEINFKVHHSFDSVYLDNFCRELTSMVNNVFSKTTNRRFKYNGVQLVNDWPTSSSTMYYPENGFKITVFLVPIGVNGESGHCLIDDGNIIVLYFLTNITEKPTQQHQNIVCHEIAHGFGVAIGEYYSVRLLVDFTGVLPEYKVSVNLLKDNYWHTEDHLSWLTDPMLIFNPTDTKFCWLSSYLINSGKYRDKPPLPDLFNIRIKILVEGTPINSSWDVMIWRNSKIFYDKIGVYHANKDGIVTFPWNACQTNHWTEALSDNFRIIKVFNNGIPITAKGISIWDVEEAYIKSSYSLLYEVVLK